MSAKNDNSAVIKAVIIIISAAVIIFLIFNFMLKKNGSTDQSGEKETLTPVEEITTIDLSTSYPTSPTAVVELYSKIMQVMYKYDYTDDEFSKMANVLGGLFDDELMANQVNYPSGIKSDVTQKKTDDYAISTYTVQSASDISYTQVDGYDVAYVQCIYAVRHSTATQSTVYLFVLRKDSAGLWKIYGWTSENADE
ncbi:MAG: hypothetical protein K6B41_10160 [Butyrivibrio sp.]|nr:hypothetical protein [Butyrivibrio sp.]